MLDTDADTVGTLYRDGNAWPGNDSSLRRHFAAGVRSRQLPPSRRLELLVADSTAMPVTGHVAELAILSLAELYKGDS